MTTSGTSASRRRTCSFAPSTARPRGRLSSSSSARSRASSRRSAGLIRRSSALSITATFCPGNACGRRKLGKVNGELVYLDMSHSPVDYLEAWELQRRVHARRVADEIPDGCIMLEHQPVYTAGKRTAASDRPFGDPGAPVIDVDRGGKITWHGPGQLTGYPIIKLRQPVDVVAYVRALEEALIRTCADFGVLATRVEGRSGAWLAGGQAGPGQAGADGHAGASGQAGA